MWHIDMIDRIIRKFRSDLKVTIIKTIIFVIFFIYAVSLIYPIFWIGLNSLKTKFEFLSDVFNMPKNPQWDNYTLALVRFKVTVGAGEAAKEVNMLGMFLNSFLLTGVATFGEIFFSALAAYAVCFYKFPMRRALYSIIIFTLVVPLVGTLPAMYKFMNDIGLINTIPGVTFLYANGIGFSFILLYGSYQNLSWSYAEAAKVDGAGHFRTYFQIMMPLSMPFITAAAIIAAIGFWNNYETPAIFLQNYPTVSVGINTIIIQVERSSTDRNNYPLMFASMIITVIPIIILFTAFQKTIMKNMVAGGLKG